jgi:hypothetical protein
MLIEDVKKLLTERLTTAKLMRQAASVIDVSLATMYRYKSDPSAIPFGALVNLGKYLAFPIEGTVVWSKQDVPRSELRRFQLESAVAMQEARGSRFTVTPSYSVNVELPEVTQFLWNFDYGRPSSNGELDRYLEHRCARRKMYLEGKYNSLELITGNGYRDFFNGKGRFKGVPTNLRQKQVKELIRTLDLPHVIRRLYLKNTPELPVFTCYSNAVAVIRVDDFTVEFSGTSAVQELTEVFQNYFANADVKTKEEMVDFLKHPNQFEE